MPADTLLAAGNQHMEPSLSPQLLSLLLVATTHLHSCGMVAAGKPDLDATCETCEQSHDVVSANLGVVYNDCLHAEDELHQLLLVGNFSRARQVLNRCNATTLTSLVQIPAPAAENAALESALVPFVVMRMITVRSTLTDPAAVASLRGDAYFLVNSAVENGGASVAGVDWSGATSLMYAVAAADYSLVELLLYLGGAGLVARVDNAGKTSLIRLLEDEDAHGAIAAWWLRYTPQGRPHSDDQFVAMAAELSPTLKAEWDRRDRLVAVAPESVSATTILAVCNEWKLPFLQAMLKMCASHPNGTDACLVADQYGRDPLFYAASTGNVPAIDALLRVGMSFYTGKTDVLGANYLHAAARRGHQTVISTAERENETSCRELMLEPDYWSHQTPQQALSAVAPAGRRTGESKYFAATGNVDYDDTDFCYKPVGISVHDNNVEQARLSGWDSRDDVQLMVGLPLLTDTLTSESSDSIGGCGCDIAVESIDTMDPASFFNRYVATGRPVLLRRGTSTAPASRNSAGSPSEGRSNTSALHEQWLSHLRKVYARRESWLSRHDAVEPPQIEITDRRHVVSSIPYGAKFGGTGSSQPELLLSVAEFVQQHMSLTNETAVELRHNRDANYLFVKTTAGHSALECESPGEPCEWFMQAALACNEEAGICKHIHSDTVEQTVADNTNRQLYMGDAGTGAPFHTHIDAWNVLLHGRKRWWLTPPASATTSREPSIDWYTRTYAVPLPFTVAAATTATASAAGSLPGKQTAGRTFECVQDAGEVLYVPQSWGHATLNLRQSVGLAQEFRKTPALSRWQTARQE